MDENANMAAAHINCDSIGGTGDVYAAMTVCALRSVGVPPLRSGVLIGRRRTHGLKPSQLPTDKMSASMGYLSFRFPGCRGISTTAESMSPNICKCCHVQGLSKVDKFYCFSSLTCHYEKYKTVIGQRSGRGEKHVEAAHDNLFKELP